MIVVVLKQDLIQVVIQDTDYKVYTAFTAS